MEFHPIANVFPLLEGEEFEALKDDIAKNGLIEPIWLHPNGSILDGRNRWLACQATNTNAHFKNYEGDLSTSALISFVFSLNKERRHLTSSQLAACAVKAGELLEQLEREARERRATFTGNQYTGGLVEKIPQEQKGKSRDHVAAIFGTNGRYVSDAKILAKEAPELLEEVHSGKRNIRNAMRELKQSQDKKEQQLKPFSKSPILIVGRAENIPQIENDTIDLIITSPPYNLKREHWPMGGDGRQPRENGIGYDTHNDNMPENEYQDWQINCLKEMYRVAKSGASLFYNHKVRTRNGMSIFPHHWLFRDDNPWIIRQEIIWDRTSTHNHSPQLFWPEDERIFWLTKDKPTLPDRSIGHSTVWHEFGPKPDSSWHPAPFTEELPKMIIKAIGRNGITILDPFAGSCTTIKVALEFGYDAIGIDISREYLSRVAKEYGWTVERDY